MLSSDSSSFRRRKTRQHFARLSVVAGPLFLLLFSFQNCAKQSGAGQTSLSSAQGVVTEANASQFDTIHYSPQVVTEKSQLGMRLDLDVTNQSMQITLADGSNSSCTLDANRAGQLQQILQQSEICEPDPTPQGEVTCEAMPNWDIDLTSSNSPDAKMSLAVPTCNQGAYLCSSAAASELNTDQNFRALLADLISSPPAGCVAN